MRRDMAIQMFAAPQNTTPCSLNERGRFASGFSLDTASDAMLAYAFVFLR